MSIDIDSEYRRAEIVYMRGHYAEAAAIIDLLAANFPDCPRIHLFRGYIYSYGLEGYEIAKQEYDLVLALVPEDRELVNSALRKIIDLENLLRNRRH